MIRDNSLCYVVYDCYLVLYFYFFWKLRIVILLLSFYDLEICYTTKLVLIAMLVKQVLFALAAMLDIQVILALIAI